MYCSSTVLTVLYSCMVVWSQGPPLTSVRCVLYCTVLWCIVLYCTVLYCSVLYCTILMYGSVEYRATTDFCNTVFTLRSQTVLVRYGTAKETCVNSALPYRTDLSEYARSSKSGAVRFSTVRQNICV